MLKAGATRLGALALALLALTAGLSACDNTIRGVGADARETDQALHQAAQ